MKNPGTSAGEPSKAAPRRRIRKPSNRIQRCNQVLAWLTKNYPCGRNVTLKWANELKHKGEDGKYIQEYGRTERVGSNLVITLSLKKCRDWVTSIDILIHEYTHCLLWGMARVEDHPLNDDHSVAFDAQERYIYRRYQTGGGAEESYEYEY